MDFNTTLFKFGLDSSNFKNKELISIESENEIIYEVEEENKMRKCPFCLHHPMYIHTYKWENIKLSSSIQKQELLRIKRIRYKCTQCNKTHTFNLDGIKRSHQISNAIHENIKKEFFLMQSFSSIAARYQLSVTEVIRLFDKEIVEVPRKTFPEYLCIDEKHFEGDTEGKYCVVLSDFLTGKIIDIIKDRRMPYLVEYFSKVSLRERKNVKVVISDMYEGYSTIKDSFFQDALFVVDLFHVIKLLSTAVNKLRIRTYNQILIDDTIERHFLKSNWKVFLCNKKKIKNKEYYSKKFDFSLPTDEMINRCLKTNMVFWDGYDALQELFNHKDLMTYSDAERFVDRIIKKLELTNDELLIGVARSYQKWKVGIINGLAKNQTKRRLSNAIAECNNSHIQKAIDVAYGYRNFKRFRNRILLLTTYKKEG